MPSELRSNAADKPVTSPRPTVKITGLSAAFRDSLAYFSQTGSVDQGLIRDSRHCRLWVVETVPTIPDQRRLKNSAFH